MQTIPKSDKIWIFSRKSLPGEVILLFNDAGFVHLTFFSVNPRLLLLVFLCGAAVSWAEVQGSIPPASEIQQTAEYEFQTVDGAAYLVEGSVDGQNWSTLAGPVFGNGGLAKAILPPTAAAMHHYRVRAVNAALYGVATTLLSGKMLALNEQGRPRQVIFLPSSKGVRLGILITDPQHARSFEWQVERGSGDTASVVLKYKDGTTSQIDLNFSTGQLGAYQMRDRDAAGAVQVVESGPFSLHVGRIRDNAAQAVLPLSLVGQSMLLAEGSGMTLFEFSAGGWVKLTREDGTTEQQQYQFTSTASGQADLRVEVPGQYGQVYQLNLNTQATGTYTRIPLVFPGAGGAATGSLTHTGTFNLPTPAVVASSESGPPKSISGETLELGGDDPVTLKFNDDGTGTATKEKDGTVEVTPFNYDYSPTDQDEASLALTFPGAVEDRVEDFDLTFSAGDKGSFSGTNFAGGESVGTSSGSFAAR